MKGRKTRLTLVIGAIAILALALVSWLFILSPRLSQAAKVQADADQLATANLTLHTRYNQGVTLAKDAPSAAQEAQALFATMPEQADLPAVIEQITAAAEDAGIPAQQVTTISTSVPTAVSGRVATASGDDAAPDTGVAIATMQVDISASGTQEQVLEFLDNLQALDRALLITSTQLTDAGSEPDARPGAATQAIQIGGTMFVLESKLPDLVASMQTLLPPDLGGTGGASASPSPGASPAATPGEGATPSGAASPAASPAAGTAPSSTPVPLQPQSS